MAVRRAKGDGPTAYGQERIGGEGGRGIETIANRFTSSRLSVASRLRIVAVMEAGLEEILRLKAPARIDGRAIPEVAAVKKTIYLLNIDDYAPELTALTYPHVEFYAGKIGAETYVIDTRKFPEWDLDYEKLQICGARVATWRRLGHLHRFGCANTPRASRRNGAPSQGHRGP